MFQSLEQKAIKWGLGIEKETNDAWQKWLICAGEISQYNRGNRHAKI